MTNKCKLCGDTILGKDYVKHRKFNEMLSTKENKVDFIPFCGKCVRSMMNLADAIDAPQDKYDWRRCKARLNVDRILSRNKLEDLNPKYVEFLEENKDKTFTLKIRDESESEEILDKQLLSAQYMFEELPDMLWNFYCTDLIITKNGKEHKY